ncbi:ABC-type multidrug transport system fused ATPase/permease subunit, partial [Rhizobium petrolearium]|uniref:ATP-binding cassette domain-containing protein n=1 Tax=Neorhizobium petrolearium TaxID=515361 RepID=UPI001F304217
MTVLQDNRHLPAISLRAVHGNSVLSGTAKEQAGGSVTPVLSVKNLSTSFRVNDEWRTVVRNISFDVAPRETVAIVGESGSGKSVTSLSIMRLLPK